MLKTSLIGSLVGSFMYVVAPAADINISRLADFARAGYSVAPSEKRHPETTKSAILMHSVYADGFHASDNLTYLYAKYSGNLDTCFSAEDIENAEGRVITTMHDNADCLSEITGVSIEDLEPEADGSYHHQRFVRVHGKKPAGYVDPETLEH